MARVSAAMIAPPSTSIRLQGCLSLDEAELHQPRSDRSRRALMRAGQRCDRPACLECAAQSVVFAPAPGHALPQRRAVDPVLDLPIAFLVAFLIAFLGRALGGL